MHRERDRSKPTSTSLPAGTYTISANVKSDPKAPAVIWQLDTTSFTPTPKHEGDQGQLGESATMVTSTVSVPIGTYDVTFAVKLGTAPNTCMIVDDIKVMYVP
jgi:hypothetical protein